ncbi:hypothetical protein [Prosthecobacter sp.]|uniref:hypothetical protein n=1 Tax=Prosthecobacter sp. TaxID=1965333 RepID=UPI002ABA9ED6|nr:hypothetical protein [Prosthecobacter sp.]MDZ4405852.1 hypothetical protein [Prosthecobacter sp.]
MEVCAHARDSHRPLPRPGPRALAGGAEARSSGPKFFASGSEFFASGPKFFASSPKFFASGSEFFASSPKFFASGPEFFASSPKFFASGPEFFASSPEFFASSPEFFASSPEFFASGSEFFASGCEEPGGRARARTGERRAAAWSSAIPPQPRREDDLMPLWNSGATWSSGQLWSPVSAPAPDNNNTKTKHTKMKRQPYYPKALGEQSEWHTNFATKLPVHATALALAPAQVDAGVADNLILAYGLGDWIVSARESPTSWTSALEFLSNGSGSTNFAFPTLVVPPPPELPVGITGVKPGALQRTFKLVQVIKGLPGYTETIGLDMGIVGSEAPPPPPPGDVPPPRITVKAVPGDTQENAQIKFFKDGHEYVALESRRGSGGWEPLVQCNQSPYLDERPLLVPGQAEVREYRARFWDNGQPNGAWCDVAKVTLGP